MRPSLLIAGAILTGLFLGCGDGASLETRLESALAIQDIARKDSALRPIALDAAQSGDKEVCKKAIEGITISSIRDETAVYCLRVFRKAGNGDVALEIAKLIKVQPIRDKILSELSQR